MNKMSRETGIAAVVILYNPIEAVLSNLKTYYPYVEKIYVYDNTEGPVKNIDWAQFPKVEFHHDGRNKGIAEVLNQAVKKAREEGYDWLLTMDQDSRFTQQSIENYWHSFSKFPHKEKVALFGPVFCERDPGWQADGRKQEVDLLITSGTLLNLSLFNEIGSFDEALFIDLVDFDYCIRAQQAGYRIIQFTDVAMLHELGTTAHRSSIKTLYLVKKQKQLYLPLRCYYMYRNMLYLKTKYRHSNLPALKKVERGVKDILKNNFLYGRNNRNLIRYLLLAYKHFKENKMGKFPGLKSNA
jgi:rhamnosyltransferase